MKRSTSTMTGSKSYLGDTASTRRMLRRDLSLRGEERLPDLSKAKNMAEQLEILERYIAKAPVVDPYIRHKIRNAIATGDYTIDPHSIANKFLKFEKDLYS